ncbi:hypothetical protein [Noviherbaspirillum sp.]|uniref:hypothetical protein n=1 Tax=Noviherbaspirillum sp. TaxID=1926288 RepID=UPI002FE29D20
MSAEPIWRPRGRLLWLEPLLVWLVGALTFVAVPLSLGEIGLSWDALNHHIYLGWVAESPRFDRDFAAASYQSYQYPYLYWPVYKLALMGASGAVAGAVLALLQSLAIPPVWIIARWCNPGPGVSDICFRVASVTLAFLGGLTLSLLDSTSNDLIAATPYVWAVAFALLAMDAQLPERATIFLLLSGIAAGVAVAFKLSNGPLTLVLPFLWGIGQANVQRAVYNVASAGAALICSFIIVYAPWGMQLWREFGNPIYPFHDDFFELLRFLVRGES